MVINLTQHAATPEQRKAGVFDLGEEDRQRLSKELTFHSLPSRQEIERKARNIAALAKNTGLHPAAHAAMIGGAPYLMGPLERELKKEGITPQYAFSRRESVDEEQEDGTVKKTTIFRHQGFVAVP